MGRAAPGLGGGGAELPGGALPPAPREVKAGHAEAKAASLAASYSKVALEAHVVEVVAVAQVDVAFFHVLTHLHGGGRGEEGTLRGGGREWCRQIGSQEVRR